MPLTTSIDLEGQAAIVTGGARGIGAALARGLAACHADVTIADLPERNDDLTRLVQDIKTAGGNAQAKEVDVTDHISINSLVAHVVSIKGKLDVMINNAGVINRSPAITLTEKEWDNVHNVNLKGVFFGCQAAAREMIKTGGGKIVNTASELAFVSPKKNISATYMASKGGVANLTRALAVEWADCDIRVNAVAPGPTNTQMLASAVADPERLARTLADIPSGRLMEPEDLVGAVLFLASDLSAMVTGHIILVDGGRSLV